MISRILSILVALAGGVLASQAPGFTQQYVQNLEGRVAELERIVTRFDATLARIGYDREEALSECAGATALLGALCEGIAEDVARYDRLRAHRAELKAAADWARPAVLARTAEPEVARSAYAVFEPALPATPAGAAYAGVGFAAGWSAATLLLAVLALPFGRAPVRRAASS